MSQIHLLLGGARSGKSSLAERYARDSGLAVTYLATAEALDNEMQQRIDRHQQDRPSHWQLVETPLALGEAIMSAGKANQCLLVDCLTLWLTNALCQQGIDYWLQEKSDFLQVLEQTRAIENLQIILVSNEVGHGIVPMGDLSRQFVDEAGWLHQSIGKMADKVEFVIAGLPLSLK